MKKIILEEKVFKRDKVKNKEKQVELIKRHYIAKYNFHHGVEILNDSIKLYSFNCPFIRGNINLFHSIIVVRIYFDYQDKRLIKKHKNEYDRINNLIKKNENTKRIN